MRTATFYKKVAARLSEVRDDMAGAEGIELLYTCFIPHYLLYFHFIFGLLCSFSSLIAIFSFSGFTPLKGQLKGQIFMPNMSQKSAYPNSIRYAPSGTDAAFISYAVFCFFGAFAHLHT